MRPLSLGLYQFATSMLEPFAPWLLRVRASRGKEDPSRLSERLGVTHAPRPEGRLVWLHGASVGESLSLLPLMEELRARQPDLAILVTSGTATSAQMMAARAPEGVIHQYASIDAPRAAKRFLEHWKPDLAVFVESEIWPNLIFSAVARRASLALLSARLSDSSLKGWARVPRAAKAVFSAFDLVMAQNDATAAALTRLGARDDGRLNLKRLGAPPPVDADALSLLRRSKADRPVLLAASTHPGEDQIVLDAFRQAKLDAWLVIAPRHPARAIEIEAMAQAGGFTTGRRSQGADLGQSQVYIADTLGELGLWFSLADAAFIGGSLAPGPGGHNPVEAAQLDCPIVTGPYLDNWREIYDDLFRADAAVAVDDAQALAQAFADALGNPAAARERAARARQALACDQGALNLALESLISLLP